MEPELKLDRDEILLEHPRIKENPQAVKQPGSSWSTEVKSNRRERPMVNNLMEGFRQATQSFTATGHIASCWTFLCPEF